jgi:phosphate transport system substrate-binding protein
MGSEQAFEGVPATGGLDDRGLEPKQHGFTLLLCAAALMLVCGGAFLYFSHDADDAALLTGSVHVVGSESLRPSVTACAQDFMMKNPRTDVIVRGGGSGDGVAALLHGLTEVAMASRELTQREREYARVNTIALAEFPMALDGVAIIVNRANPLADVSLAQLRDIFAGRLRDWSELGAGHGAIRPFARAAGSGTAFMFGERVLGQETYAASVQRLSTNEAIVAEVAAQRESIGYTDLGALKRGSERVKAIALRADEQSPPVMVSAESIAAGRYPLSRRLILVAAGSLTGVSKAFVDFCQSASGQDLFQRAGFIVAGHAVPQPGTE